MSEWERQQLVGTREPASLADCSAVFRRQAALLLGNHQVPVDLGMFPGAMPFL